jgi:alpha-tubulin suppressor-like RCC1 family protein
LFARRIKLPKFAGKKESIMTKNKSEKAWNYLVKTVWLTAISVTAIFVLSATLSAQTRGWGRNNSGQLGIGNFNTPQPSPVTVPDSGSITAISAGEFFTLFLKADGTVLGTGDNTFGQIGDGTQTVRSSPVAVINLSNVAATSASQLHSLALLQDGTMMAWGRNAEGQLGNGGGGSGQFSAAPIPVINLTNVMAIASGGVYSLALKSDGTVWAWGSNSDGQLGNGTTPNSNPHGTPAQVGANVAGFTNIIAISAGVNHAVALKSDGTVWVWGSNVFGEAGNGAAGGNQLVPVQNSALFGVSQIAAAWHYSYALKSDGNLFAWGYNVRGNLGNGTTNSTGCQCNPLPQQTSITNVVDIKATDEHALARKTDGSVWAWGWNLHGQLGDGTTLTTGCQCRAAPVQLTAAGTGNSIIAAGYFHSFAAQLSAASVSVGGRVLTASGYGVARAHIILTNQSGDTRTATANTFGYYRFDGVPVGTTYTFNVLAKQYQFMPRVLTVTQAISDLNFTALDEVSAEKVLSIEPDNQMTASRP